MQQEAQKQPLPHQPGAHLLQQEAQQQPLSIQILEPQAAPEPISEILEPPSSSIPNHPGAPRQLQLIRNQGDSLLASLGQTGPAEMANLKHQWQQGGASQTVPRPNSLAVDQQAMSQACILGASLGTQPSPKSAVKSAVSPTRWRSSITAVKDCLMLSHWTVTIKQALLLSQPSYSKPASETAVCTCTQ